MRGSDSNCSKSLRIPNSCSTESTKQLGQSSSDTALWVYCVEQSCDGRRNRLYIRADGIAAESDMSVLLVFCLFLIRRKMCRLSTSNCKTNSTIFTGSPYGNAIFLGESVTVNPRTYINLLKIAETFPRRICCMSDRESQSCTCFGGIMFGI